MSKPCKDCGGSVSPPVRSYLSSKDRCDECDRKRRRAKENRRKKKALVEKRSQEPRFCVDCFADMDPLEHKARKRCPSCVDAAIEAGRYSREASRAKRAALRAKRDEARRLYESAKKRAAFKGLAFTITVDDIVIPENCPVFGEPLLPPSLCGPNPMMPSIDRIDCRRGYEPGNVQVMSHRANTLKNDASIAELEALLAFLKRKMQN